MKLQDAQRKKWPSAPGRLADMAEEDAKRVSFVGSLRDTLTA